MALLSAGLLHHVCTDACRDPDAVTIDTQVAQKADAGVTPDEIAKQLQIPPPTVALILARRAIPLQFYCTECTRMDPRCPHCGGTGVIAIKGCPYEFITEDVWELRNANDLFEEWPSRKDWRDEPIALVAGLQYLRSELHRNKPRT